LEPIADIVEAIARLLGHALPAWRKELARQLRHRLQAADAAETN
jgi:hypothetical protein